MRDAPIAYNILMLNDYVNNSASANELYKQWQRDKKSYCA
jgi:hypothetical protein